MVFYRVWHGVWHGVWHFWQGVWHWGVTWGVTFPTRGVTWVCDMGCDISDKGCDLWYSIAITTSSVSLIATARLFKFFFSHFHLLFISPQQKKIIVIRFKFFIFLCLLDNTLLSLYDCCLSLRTLHALYSPSLYIPMLCVWWLRTRLITSKCRTILPFTSGGFSPPMLH